jgi:3-oxoadipate enol-lactonase
MFLRLGDGQLYFTTMGSGPELLLLHPTPVDHRFWLPIALDLSKCYRVIMPDLRGHGRSEPGSEPISMGRLAEDTESLLDELDVESAFFAGSSIGGYVLYELWRRIPDRIMALAFCCAKPQADSEGNRTKRRSTIETVSREGTAGFFDQMTTNMVSHDFQRRERQKTAELRAMMTGMSAESVIAVQQALMDRPDSIPTLNTISVPVLALAAAEDQASTPDEMRAIKEALPASDYRLLSNTGHYAPFEKPREVGEILAKFFALAA